MPEYTHIRVEKALWRDLKKLAAAIQTESSEPIRAPTLGETVALLLSDHASTAASFAATVAEGERRDRNAEKLLEIATDLEKHNGELLAQLKTALQEKVASQHALRIACQNLVLLDDELRERCGDVSLDAAFDRHTQTELKTRRSRWVSLMLEKAAKTVLEDARLAADPNSGDWAFDVHDRAVEIAGQLDAEREREAGNAMH